MAKGINLATDAAPHLADIQRAKLDFICRYYRTSTSHWPSLSLGEAKLLSGGGFKLVALWTAASDQAPYFTRLSGATDGASAFHRATASGQPFGTAIYFAVAYDASPAEVEGSISQYFRGVAAGLAAAGGNGGNYRIGVYGSGAVCRAMIAAGLARYGWLAASPEWRGYRDFVDACNIRQGARLPFPFEHDSDEANGDYGQFQV